MTIAKNLGYIGLIKGRLIGRETPLTRWGRGVGELERLVEVCGVLLAGQLFELLAVVCQLYPDTYHY